MVLVLHTEKLESTNIMPTRSHVRVHTSSESSSESSDVSVDDPSSDVIETLYSSEWQKVLDDADVRSEIITWAKTQWSMVDKKDFNESMDNTELIRIAAISRLLNHVHQSDYGDLHVDYLKIKKTFEQAMADNKSIRLSGKLNNVKENILRNHFNMKTMYSVFRITPFATSEVSDDSVLFFLDNQYATLVFVHRRSFFSFAYP